MFMHTHTRIYLTLNYEGLCSKNILCDHYTCYKIIILEIKQEAKNRRKANLNIEDGRMMIPVTNFQVLMVTGKKCKWKIMNYAIGSGPFTSQFASTRPKRLLWYTCELMKTGCQEGCSIKQVNISYHWTATPHHIGEMSIVSLSDRNPQLSQWCLGTMYEDAQTPH